MHGINGSAKIETPFYLSIFAVSCARVNHA
jgi:hypothetical protein